MTKNSNIEIPKDRPFLNCKLDRKPYAEVLTDVVRTNSEGFVLAIDNKWGAGKTTFISMWKQHLENQQFQTLYFNAWENDFENNPFVALTAELKTLLKHENSDTFKEVLKKGSKIAQAVIPSIVKSTVAKYVGKDVSEIIENSSKGIIEAFKEDIDSYIDRKQTLSDFRHQLEKYIQENSNENPIIFIIDELDRCRPNYAVSILENVKHLFSVKGIVFVLSIDKEQLGHAVCGVYGSDKINSDEYLRRFIDVEYSLPEPKIEKYIPYLINQYQLDSFFNLPDRINNRELSYDTTNFIHYTKFLFEHKNLTLRQQQKILMHTGMVLRTFVERAYIIPELLIFLIYLKLFENGLYIKIRRRELNHQQLVDECGDILNGEVNEAGPYFRLNIQAMILNYYNEYVEYNKKIPLDKKLVDDSIFEITSKFDIENQKEFKGLIRSERKNFQRSRISVDYLLKKIDLLDPLQSR